MVVKLINPVLLVFTTIIFTGSCVAESSDSYTTDAFELSLKKFEIAKANLEKKIEECEKKKVIVSENVFKGLDLTKEEWKIALYVLNDRAEDACEEGKRGEFVIATSIYRTTAKHYKLKATFASAYSEDLLFGHYWMKLESEALYLNISSKKREMLEKISQFQKPFHLFKALSTLDVR